MTRTGRMVPTIIFLVLFLGGSTKPHSLKLSFFFKTIKVRYNLTLEYEKDNMKKILKQFERHVKKYSK